MSNPAPTSASAGAPVHEDDEAPQGKALEEGIALCLSGGGYRAMLFHVGALWRLYELGLLRSLRRVSSVSGGSIAAGVLALKWNRLSFDPRRVQDDFVPCVVKPLRSLARTTLDASAVVLGALLPGTAADRLVASYKQHLFGEATLQDLPSDDVGPRFVINATNVQSGVLWRFMKPYMRDYRVGEVPSPRVPLAVAVAASSAFPPVLSPLVLKLEETAFVPCTGRDLQKEPFTTQVVLTDGGVYDNLGLETAFKRYRTLLVSDGGAGFEAEEEPATDWARHAYRILSVIDNQVRSLRKRQLIGALESQLRKGAYWGIGTDITRYKLGDSLKCSHASTVKLAATPTRLSRMPADLQERLINWGYAVCDAAIRRHVDPEALAPASLPYPAHPL